MRSRSDRPDPTDEEDERWVGEGGSSASCLPDGASEDDTDKVQKLAGAERDHDPEEGTE